MVDGNNEDVKIDDSSSKAVPSAPRLFQSVGVVVSRTDRCNQLQPLAETNSQHLYVDRYGGGGI